MYFFFYKTLFGQCKVGDYLVTMERTTGVHCSFFIKLYLINQISYLLQRVDFLQSFEFSPYERFSKVQFGANAIIKIQNNRIMCEQEITWPTLVCEHP